MHLCVCSQVERQDRGRVSELGRAACRRWAKEKRSVRHHVLFNRYAHSETHTDACVFAHAATFRDSPDLLQGSGRRAGAAISTVTFARERPCLWWRLPGSRTTSEDVQKNGCTLDARLRHTLARTHTHTCILFMLWSLYFKWEVGRFLRLDNKRCMWRKSHLRHSGQSWHILLVLEKNDNALLMQR